MSIVKPESIIFTFNLFIFSSEIILKKVDIPKAVLIFLPMVFSQVGRSAAALDLLGAGSFSFHPKLRERFPQENWDQLLSASYEACKLAIAAEGDNIAMAHTEGDNLAIATQGHGALDNATERDGIAIAHTEGDNLAIATEGHGARDNATERDDTAIAHTEGDNLAIATEGHRARDNATERDDIAIAHTEGDNLAIATEGHGARDNATERDDLAMTAEGDKPTIPESDAEIGSSSRRSGLQSLLQVVRIIFKRKRS